MVANDKTDSGLLSELEWLKNRVACLEAELTDARIKLEKGGFQILEEMLDRSTNSMVVHDLDGNILYANRGTFELHGYSRDEFMELGLHNLDDPESASLIASRVEAIKRDGEATFEVNHVTKDGSKIPMEVYVRLAMWQGKPAMLSIAKNIAERKQAEAALKASEEHFRTLFTTMTQGVVFQARDGRLVDANDSACRILGLTRDQMMGRTSLDPRWKAIREDGTPFPGEQHPSMVALKTGKRVSEVLMGVFSPTENETRWLLVGAAPVFGPGETAPIGAFVVFDDITRRKKAEDELAKRESLLERVFSILPIGLWFADKDGRLLRGNPAGVRIWGAEPLVPPTEYGVFKARRLPSGDPIGPDDWALLKTVRQGVVVTDELLEIEAFDGQKRVILNYSAPVVDDSGAILGAVVVNHDITERHRAQEAQKKLQASLLEAQKMESIARLAGGVAHDFNNMLAVIIGNTQVALDAMGPAAIGRIEVDEALSAALRSAELTKQLLAYARKQTISPIILDLNATVPNMLNMLRRLLGEGVVLDWKPSKEALRVKMDPSQLDRILANLVVNAGDALNGSGRVVITTYTTRVQEEQTSQLSDSRPGVYAVLSVADNGCGIDPEHLPVLFEPFFTTKPQGKGTGLGLPTVYGITKQNGGFITVDSEPGKGSVFSIHLPVANEAVSSTVKRVQMNNTPSQSETILLVEDEEALLRLATKVLSKSGYEVLPATSPEQALLHAHEHQQKIKLLVTDVVMPGMSGRDLADEVKRLVPEVKCLFMSGYSEEVIEHRGVLHEGVSFIQKPFMMNALSTKIRELIDGSIN